MFRFSTEPTKRSGQALTTSSGINSICAPAIPDPPGSMIVPLILVTRGSGCAVVVGGPPIEARRAEQNSAGAHRAKIARARRTYAATPVARSFMAHLSAGPHRREGAGETRRHQPGVGEILSQLQARASAGGT